MKNLSESQTKIIELITSEFERINAVKSSSSNKLFDVNIIYDNAKKREAIISEVTINNRHMRALYSERIEQDAEQLNNCLNELGIQAVKYNDSIMIRRIDGNRTNFNIHIYYHSEIKYVEIFPSDSIQKIGKIKNLTCYLYSVHRAESFASIEEICKEDGFTRAIQRLFN